MNNRRFAIFAGAGCAVLTLLLLGGIVLAFWVIPVRFLTDGGGITVTEVAVTAERAQRVEEVEAEATQAVIPTLTVETPPQLAEQEPSIPSNAQDAAEPALGPGSLNALYNQLNPGVVNIQIFISQFGGGQGVGSGFILDDQGHIVTNNHVVANADVVTVVFYNGFEAEAEVIGTDDDSDLAVIRVDEMAEGAHPLPLGDSDQVEVGEWVIAIGNPFSLGGTMTAGIVSAVGRTIASGATPFAIPQAIQTDAAINPGNSGGPLLNLDGEVIGVNAQIATGGAVAANAGVGFAIPANVVRRVAPVLIEAGAYQWPWLGVEGAPVNLLVRRANNLETQWGAYIHAVVPGGPADKAGLRGSTSEVTVDGLTVPVGGDVVIEADGEPVTDWNDLLVDVSQKNPGDQMGLTILRNGERRQITLTLEARPERFGP